MRTPEPRRDDVRTIWSLTRNGTTIAARVLATDVGVELVIARSPTDLLLAQFYSTDCAQLEVHANEIRGDLLAKGWTDAPER